MSITYHNYVGPIVLDYPCSRQIFAAERQQQLGRDGRVLAMALAAAPLERAQPPAE
jgi:hypothetical protein